MILTNDNEYAVVLDACVLAPMPIADTLLRLAEEPSLYRVFWTENLLEEIGGALSRMGRTTAQIERRLKFMRDHFPEAMLEIPCELLQSIPCLPDQNDRHIVAAAILGHANAIITDNTKERNASLNMASVAKLLMNFLYINIISIQSSCWRSSTPKLPASDNKGTIFSIA